MDFKLLEKMFSGVVIISILFYALIEFFKIPEFPRSLPIIFFYLA